MVYGAALFSTLINKSLMIHHKYGNVIYIWKLGLIGEVHHSAKAYFTCRRR